MAVSRHAPRRPHNPRMSTPSVSTLTIAISSRALFDLEDSHALFEEEGIEAYSNYQRAHEDDILAPGVTNPYQDEYWHWLQDELTPAQQAAAAAKGQAIAAKFRQHTGRPGHG